MQTALGLVRVDLLAQNWHTGDTNPVICSQLQKDQNTNRINVLRIIAGQSQALIFNCLSVGPGFEPRSGSQDFPVKSPPARKRKALFFVASKIP
jgi:hypothetical protein